MALFTEKFFKRFAYFFSCHCFMFDWHILGAGSDPFRSARHGFQAAKLSKILRNPDFLFTFALVIRLRHRLLCLLTAICMAVGGSAAVWEAAEVPEAGIESIEARIQDDVPIVLQAVGSKVYAVVTKTVTVKMFTILGQQVSQETLKPGSYRLNLPARGIYILRAGSITRRITL